MKSIIISILARIQRFVLAATVLGAISGAIYGAVVPVGSGPWVWQNPLPQGDTLNGVSCPNTTVCYAVGNLGTILTSTDGWKTWSGQQSGFTGNLYAISCPAANTCFAVGDRGTILSTTTGGVTWGFQNSPARRALARESSTHRPAPMRWALTSVTR